MNDRATHFDLLDQVELDEHRRAEIRRILGPELRRELRNLRQAMPDVEEEPDDEKLEHWFAEKERNGYAVLSLDEWKAKLDDAASDGYAEGRSDQIEEFAALLPGPYYMDPPDGGTVSVLEQFRRMADDAAKWRDQMHRARLAIECELRCEG